MSSPDGDRQRSVMARRILDRVPGLGREPVATATQPPPGPAPAGSPEPSDRVLARLSHLETALEALQDQVYRESQRYERELEELRAQLRPANLARAISADARNRGL